MTPGTKRTIITSKTTGRRYFLVRSANRPSGRRYYVCTNPTCKARVSREADLYCKAHAHEQEPGSEGIGNISTKSVDENDIQDNGEVIDEESSAMEQQNTTAEASFTEELNESQNNDSMHENDIENMNGTMQTDTSAALSPNSQSNRQIHVDELTGARSFRDNSGRRRYLCMRAPCTNVLKRQTDLFCRLHTSNEKQTNNDNHNINNNNNNKKKRRSQKRHSAPTTSNSSKTNRYRSPFQTPLTVTTTTTSENGTDGNQSDEYETPKKNIPQRTGTTRSFRDASGKLRFLCSIPTCHSRVPRQSEPYCRRHTLEIQAQAFEKNNIQQATTNGTVNEAKKQTNVAMNVTENGINTPSRQITPEQEIPPESKKRKREPSLILSSIPAAKIVIATTALLDDQWNDVLTFLRQFSQVQLSTNLNVNNSTTHLLVDDSENHLHCTITKKIVQAAVRHHIFIISSRWLNECMRLNKFIDEHPYEIISDSHTTLRSSQHDSNATNKYLFSQNSQYSYAFAIECRQCQGSINRSELIELIQLTGAQLFQNEQAVDVLIVLCDTSDKNLNKIKEKYMNAPASNIKYVTSDFLLKSIIKFEIQDIDKYSL
ncbi:unnamed protein product [Rotaria magnacalcarata]|uniref:BRCT domain-containing protein n=1 Tax=Rotaria magnacalcarata TaxID=392030 RepID=A0A816Z2R6_9BILA|nr:unnamed protein product [Rotaria magnacalcarata]